MIRGLDAAPGRLFVGNRLRRGTRANDREIRLLAERFGQDETRRYPGLELHWQVAVWDVAAGCRKARNPVTRRRNRAVTCSCELVLRPNSSKGLLKHGNRAVAVSLLASWTPESKQRSVEVT